MPTIPRQLPLLLVSVLIATPLVMMLATSLKRPSEIKQHPERIWTMAPQFGNYAEAVTAMPFWRALGNTALLCAGSVAGTVISCVLAAYAFSLLDWPGRNGVFGLLIATMLLPWQATMIPRFLLLRELGLYDSLAALVLPTFLGDAFSIFLLRQFFRSIPQELVDAARIDGCGDWGVLLRVVLPLSTPAIATVALFQFIAAWNDYGGPLLYLSSPEKFPLAYALEQFVSSHSSETHLLMAAAVMFTLPIVALFLLTQRTFLKGIATTGLKG